MKLIALMILVFAAHLGFAGEQIHRLEAKKIETNGFKKYSMRVNSCAGSRNVKANQIQILSRQGRLKVKDFVVTFGNRSQQRIPFRSGFFHSGDKSRWANLKGNGARCILKVTFKAKSPNAARIVLRGKRITADKLGQIAIKQGRGQNFKPHRLSIRSCQSGIKANKLKITARKGRVKVRNVWVIFGNGGKQKLNFKRAPFTNGQSSVWKDLKGANPRCIRAIKFEGLTPNGGVLVVHGKQ